MLSTCPLLHAPLPSAYKDEAALKPPQALRARERAGFPELGGRSLASAA